MAVGIIRQSQWIQQPPATVHRQSIDADSDSDVEIDSEDNPYQHIHVSNKCGRGFASPTCTRKVYRVMLHRKQVSSNPGCRSDLKIDCSLHLCAAKACGSAAGFIRNVLQQSPHMNDYPRSIRPSKSISGNGISRQIWLQSSSMGRSRCLVYS